MSTTPNIQVIFRRPKNFLIQKYENLIDFSARNLKYKTLSNIFMPSGDYNDNKYKFMTCEGTLLSEISALTDATYASSGSGKWGLAQGSFGMGETSIAQFDTAQTWYVYSNTNNVADTCPIIFGRWAPNGSANAPNIVVFPRMDTSKSFTSGGFTYFFCPFTVQINGMKGLTIYEYQYDDYDAYTASPSSCLTKTLEIPIGEQKYASIDNNIYWNIGFIPIDFGAFYMYGNINGRPFGHCYYSKIYRENIQLLGPGNVGAAYNTAGSGLLFLGKLQFTSNGTIISDKLSKPYEDTTYPDLSTSSYLPSGTSIAVTLQDENGTVINDGDVFQDFYYKATLTKTTTKTPVLFYVNVDFEGSFGADTDTGIDVSDDIVSITERIGNEVGSYSSTIKLRNDEGQYNYMLNRIMFEVDYYYNGVQKALLYTNNLGLDWFATPQIEFLTASYECGDGWTKLDQQLCFNIPALDGMNIKDGIEQFFLYLGWPATMVDICDIDFTVPSQIGAQDFLYRPEDGQQASEFLKNFLREFLSNYIVRFSNTGVFTIIDPDSAEVQRTFYLSEDDATAAYNADLIEYGAGMNTGVVANDYTYYVMGDVNLTWLFNDFKNEIWVCGHDEMIEDNAWKLYIDYDSEYNVDYPWYIGDRRVWVGIFNILDEYVLDYVLNELGKRLVIPKVTFQFKSKIDENLFVGDFIKIYPYDLLFRVENIDYESTPDNVSYQSGNIYGMTVSCISWDTSLPDGTQPIDF